MGLHSHSFSEPYGARWLCCCHLVHPPNSILQTRTLLFPFKGEQNTGVQNVSIWHVDYFELKMIKAQQIHEKLFTFPLLPKIIQIEDLYQKQVMPKITFCRKDLHAQNDKYLFTKHLLLLSSCESSSSPLKPQIPTLPSQLWMTHKAKLPDCLWVSLLCGSIHTKSIFLLLICLMSVLTIRPAKEPKREEVKSFPLLHFGIQDGALHCLGTACSVAATAEKSWYF